MGSLEAVCISRAKGEVKFPVDEALLLENWGIDGDAHAGDWHRQVSLLAGESIDRMKEILPTLGQGAFAENLIIRGVDLADVRVGDRFRIGDAELEITQIGKECHHGCAIREQTGDCIMPREGLFTRVIRGGRIATGCQVELLPGGNK